MLTSSLVPSPPPPGRKDKTRGGRVGTTHGAVMLCAGAVVWAHSCVTLCDSTVAFGAGDVVMCVCAGAVFVAGV